MNRSSFQFRSSSRRFPRPCRPPGNTAPGKYNLNRELIIDKSRPSAVFLQTSRRPLVNPSDVPAPWAYNIQTDPIQQIAKKYKPIEPNFLNIANLCTKSSYSRNLIRLDKLSSSEPDEIPVATIRECYEIISDNPKPTRPDINQACTKIPNVTQNEFSSEDEGFCDDTNNVIPRSSPFKSKVPRSATSRGVRSGSKNNVSNNIDREDSPVDRMLANNTNNRNNLIKDILSKNNYVIPGMNSTDWMFGKSNINLVVKSKENKNYCKNTIFSSIGDGTNRNIPKHNAYSTKSLEVTTEMRASSSLAAHGSRNNHRVNKLSMHNIGRQSFSNRYRLEHVPNLKQNPEYAGKDYEDESEGERHYGIFGEVINIRNRDVSTPGPGYYDPKTTQNIRTHKIHDETPGYPNNIESVQKILNRRRFERLNQPGPGSYNIPTTFKENDNWQMIEVKKNNVWIV